ncbi:hypothetical protein CQ010_01330 [Arthrobacter sp. MYb211]|uniref:3'-5' exoribonuclease domain-containing protein n=1 Tax=unclassified Arthrobacter TaxID=235627 RepID=UPI000CFA8FB5|nr:MULTISPECIES: 3'-5' exoribonuclease [unclassified Arthrobacter]PRA13316.1 hypothetical protein CQ015_03585 [Arthrobacter sp. MYb221]PRC10513.1 hypothetical protein CQ010_01330 [Arthrobacter sp. MYb211]
MKYFYDTEFLEDGKSIELISIGIVAEDGREYYAVNSDMPVERIKKHEWLMRNVFPSLPMGNVAERAVKEYTDSSPNYHPLPSLGNVELDLTSTLVKPVWVIRNEVREFLLFDDTDHVNKFDRTQPELWAWYSAYDHVVLAQLFGPMILMPKGIPMYTNDVRSLSEWTGVLRLPRQQDGAHNALADARHVKTMHNHIVKESIR